MQGILGAVGILDISGSVFLDATCCGVYDAASLTF